MLSAPKKPLDGTAAFRARDLRTSIRPTRAEIDIGALARNAQRVRAQVGPGVAVYGVVKADAYGHGAAAVAPVLEPLCDVLAVSLVEEGIELRQAGVTKPILVLGAYYGDSHSDALEHELTPVIYDFADLERFAQAPARRAGPRSSRAPGAERIDVHLKIDTGMSRLGVMPHQLGSALDYLAALPRLRLAGVCTHFACADAPDEEPTRLQLDRFRACLAEVRGRGFAPDVVHAANSAAALRFAGARFDAVRPGLALYGAAPAGNQATLAGAEPVLRLTTRIMALHDVPPGTSVSYGAHFTARRPSRIATLPVGYADGYPRHVRGAQTLVRGQRAPIAGAVCMDMLMIDVTDVPGVAVGDDVTLVGSSDAQGGDAIGIDELAAWAGTISYEIMCGISKRVPRLYAGAATHAGAAGAT